MKRIILVQAFILYFISIRVYPQQEEISTMPIIEIFTDFHYELGNDSALSSGFGLNRAYFGYKFNFEKNFVTSVIVDIGSPLDLPEDSKSRRYAHFREVSAGYSGEKFSLIMGITGTRIFNYQQRFWGKRYVASTYQSINGYGYIADLGVVADLKINSWLQGDISLMNGKGYSSIQMDKSLKGSLGFTVTPTENLSLRIYSDLMRRNSLWQNTIIGFIGFRNDLFYLGAEASYKSNLDLNEGHDAWGFSSTGGISITKRTEIFMRYDYSSSAIPDGEIIEWNHQIDRTFLIAGIQYIINKYTRVALDYQSSYPFDENQPVTDYIYLNAQVKF